MRCRSTVGASFGANEAARSDDVRTLPDRLMAGEYRDSEPRTRAAGRLTDTEDPRAEVTVKVLIVAPAPLDDPRSGGIASFIRGFIRFMPADFEAEILGVAVGNQHAGAGWH